MFTERLLTSDAKATFNQAALDIGIHTIDNCKKVLTEMTKHAFPAYALRKQKRYLCRHLVKPRSMKLRRFISRFPLLRSLSSWHRKQGTWIFTCRWNHGLHLPLHAHHVEKQNDWTRFQLHRFFHQRNDWFLLN